MVALGGIVHPTALNAPMTDHFSPTPESTPTAALALSIDQAATALSISPRLVRTLIARGELRSARIGRRIVIPTGALRELLSAATQ